ncbi:MAG: hypothetical protein KAR01_02455 [Desulfocapsa sp.]|nr:hypothetical protein [Desulfocapsa sp.]
MSINIFSIILLLASVIVGFGGGFFAKKKYGDDEAKITKVKIITKSIALLGMIGALIISMYF